MSCFSQQEKSGPYGRKYDDSIVTMPSTRLIHTCQTMDSHSPEVNVLTLCLEVTAATPHEQALVAGHTHLLLQVGSMLGNVCSL